MKRCCPWIRSRRGSPTRRRATRVSEVNHERAIGPRPPDGDAAPARRRGAVLGTGVARLLAGRGARGRLFDPGALRPLALVAGRGARGGPVAPRRGHRCRRRDRLPQRAATRLRRRPPPHRTGERARPPSAADARRQTQRLSRPAGGEIVGGPSPADAWRRRAGCGSDGRSPGSPRAIPGGCGRCWPCSCCWRSSTPAAIGASA